MPNRKNPTPETDAKVEPAKPRRKRRPVNKPTSPGASVKVHGMTGKIDKRTQESRVRAMKYGLKARQVRELFVETLGLQGGVLEWTCDVLGISETNALHYRRKFPDFAEAWDEAVRASSAVLESEAQRRAIQGSDRMLQFMLKARLPAVYGDRVAVQHSGSIDTNVKEKSDEELLKIAFRSGSSTGTTSEEELPPELPGLH